MTGHKQRPGKRQKNVVLAPVITKNQTRKLLKRVNGVPLLVLGDVILDEYLEGRVSRISPEAPIPILQVDNERRSLGGASYVAALASALGGRVRLAGVVGDDPTGEALFHLAEKSGLDTRGLLTGLGRMTPLKTRLTAQGQQLVRCDREDPKDLSKAMEKQVVLAVKEALKEVKGVILSDYRKGTLTAGIVKNCLAEAHRLGIPVLVDPKPQSIKFYKKASILKPNMKEAEEAAGLEPGEGDRYEVLASRLLKFAPKADFLVTHGARGIILIQSGKTPILYQGRAREVFDVTGAGDAVAAVVGLLRAAGVSTKDAAGLGILAGSVAVAHQGTSVFSPKDLLDAAGNS